MSKKLFLSLFLICTGYLATANVHLPAIFGDNMVLQGKMKVPFWGWADPGERIILEIGGHYAETTASADGKWRVYMGPLDSGGPFRMVIKGKNTIILHNVLVGEVWVCSGQSNMAMEVRNCRNAVQEISAAHYPSIRYFQVKRGKSSVPREDVFPAENNSRLNKWEICDPSTAGYFSAAGYFFARDLYRHLKVPVGLISASWGGTTAEAWTPHDTLEKDPDLAIILDHWPDYNNDEEWLKKEYENYINKVKKAKKEGETRPLYFNEPSVLYNGIISPVIPYAIRGVIWYQGESNAYRAYQYRDLFPAMIVRWRRKWGQGNFPFLFVQLANYQFEPQVFPELREAQTMALSVINTAMAVTIDIGDSSNIHPKNKQEVGRRLSLAARKLAYGENIIYSGPLFRSMEVTNGKCRLSFCYTGDGLIAKGFAPLQGFTIAGSDKKFVPAQARIENNQVVVWSDEIPSPVAVRYAWENDPGKCNLYNKSGEWVNLPASPFRTDDWPGITINRK